jgi:hypothetical protein
LDLNYLINLRIQVKYSLANAEYPVVLVEEINLILVVPEGIVIEGEAP